MNRRLVALVFGLILSVAGRASAAAIPLFTISIDGQSISDLPLFEALGSEDYGVNTNAGWVFDNGTNLFFTTDDALGSGHALIADLSFSAFGSSDPFLNYSLDLTNRTVDPVSYSLTFALPFIDGPYSTLTHSTFYYGNSTLVNLSYTQVAQATGLGSSTLPCVISGGGADCVAAPLVGSTGVSTGSFGANLLFSLGLNETAMLAGNVTLDGVPTDPAAVPEPASLLLLGTGVTALVARRRRSRR